MAKSSGAAGGFPRVGRQGRTLVPALLLLLLGAEICGQEPASAPAGGDELLDLSLEALMNVEISSVSKKAEPLQGAPAAIFVITRDDIRRSGARTLPDILRLAPGLDVGQMDGNKWAISARGFSQRFANKMLVLIDGRVVYTPLFSGVYWDAQDVMIEDIERVEVIRGPGATLWGANAVNGVINIITRSAEDTQGGLVSGGAGTEERGFASARWGFRISDTAALRLWMKYFDREDTTIPFEGDAHDGWDRIHGGFRLDWKPDPDNDVMIQGDAWSADVGDTYSAATPIPFVLETANVTSHTFGADVVARWDHRFEPGSNVSVQFVYDHTRREEHRSEQRRDTLNLEAEHRFQPFDGHELTWGLGYQLSMDEFDGSYALNFDIEGRNDQIFSAFAQDAITIIEDTLRVVVGSKFEHNSYTGFEVQPGIRLQFTPNPDVSVWASAARAARTPSRAEHDLRVNMATILDPATLTPTTLAGFGHSRTRSEELWAWEAGVRFRPADNVFVDLAVFYNVYDDLTTLEPGAPFFEPEPAPPHVVVPIRFDNRMDGETWGCELSTTWQVTDFWRLSGSWSFLDMALHRDHASLDPTAEDAEGQSPEHRFTLVSRVDITSDIDFDVVVHYTGNRPAEDIPSWFRLDLRLAWRPCSNAEIAVGVQNLLDDHHPERGTDLLGQTATEIDRLIYLQAVVTF